jgi:hypothetical protein
VIQHSWRLLTDVSIDLGALWITTDTGAAHLVNNSTFTAQWADGVFQSRCGAWIRSGSLCDPVGEPCARCMPSWATSHPR